MSYMFISIMYVFLSLSVYIKNQQFTLFPILVQHHKGHSNFLPFHIYVTPLSSTKNIFINLINSPECNPSSITTVVSLLPMLTHPVPGLGCDLHLLSSCPSSPHPSQECPLHFSSSLRTHTKLPSPTWYRSIVSHLGLQHPTVGLGHHNPPPTHTHTNTLTHAHSHTAPMDFCLPHSHLKVLGLNCEGRGAGNWKESGTSQIFKWKLKILYLLH